MRFFNSLLAAGMAMTGLTSAAAMNTNSIQPRLFDATPFKDLDIDGDTWDKLEKYCKDGIDTRGIERRGKPDGFDEVKPGNIGDKMHVLPGGLWTDFLVTCHGVIVTGKTSNFIKSDRFLAHFYASESLLDSQWNDFESKVKDAGLTDMKAYLNAPFTDTSKGFPKDIPKKDADKIEEKMIDLLKTLTGNTPIVDHHDASKASARQDDQGTSQVDKDLKVKMNGANF